MAKRRKDSDLIVESGEGKQSRSRGRIGQQKRRIVSARRGQITLIERIGVRSTGPWTPVNPHEVITKSREGSSRAKVDEVRQMIGLTNKEIAQILNMAERTLLQKKGEDKLSSAATERLIKLEEVIKHGLDVFEGDNETLGEWMRTPIASLNDQSPLDVLDTMTGIELTNDILTRIEYGVIG